METYSFAVAVVDKNLGSEATGIDLANILRERQPRTRLILITGYASHASAVQALRAGIVDYLEKPFDTDVMGARITQAASNYAVEIDRDGLLRNYETMFEVVPSIVWFTTDHGVFSRVSKQGADLLALIERSATRQEMGYATGLERLKVRPADIVAP